MSHNGVAAPQVCPSLLFDEPPDCNATMARQVADREEWDDDDEDDWQDSSDEYPDEELTIPCPYCDEAIPEDVARCPYCGNYISEEDAPPSRKPWWIVVGVLVCLYIIYRWTVG